MRLNTCAEDRSLAATYAATNMSNMWNNRRPACVVSLAVGAFARSSAEQQGSQKRAAVPLTPAFASAHRSALKGSTLLTISLKPELVLLYHHYADQKVGSNESSPRPACQTAAQMAHPPPNLQRLQVRKSFNFSAAQRQSLQPLATTPQRAQESGSACHFQFCVATATVRTPYVLHCVQRTAGSVAP